MLINFTNIIFFILILFIIIYSMFSYIRVNKFKNHFFEMLEKLLDNPNRDGFLNNRMRGYYQGRSVDFFLFLGQNSKFKSEPFYIEPKNIMNKSSGFFIFNPSCPTKNTRLIGKRVYFLIRNLFKLVKNCKEQDLRDILEELNAAAIKVETGQPYIRN